MSNERFQELLDQNYCWPAYYPFRFIVPVGQLITLKMAFPTDTSFVEKPSPNGKYISVHLSLLMRSSAEVLAVYQSLQDIEGLISL